MSFFLLYPLQWLRRQFRQQNQQWTMSTPASRPSSDWQHLAQKTQGSLSSFGQNKDFLLFLTEKSELEDVSSLSFNLNLFSVWTFGLCGNVLHSLEMLRNLQKLKTHSSIFLYGPLCQSMKFSKGFCLGFICLSFSSLCSWNFVILVWNDNRSWWGFVDHVSFILNCKKLRSIGFLEKQVISQLVEGQIK